MHSREISEGLPPPRDDEPPSLRRDIVDEIVDHLQCAVRRELLARGGDEAAALQRVLVSFGDPRQVARKLWRQAMWSKIMTQRLMMVGTILTTVACVALVGMMSWMMQQQQRLNVAMLEQLATLAQVAQEARATAPPSAAVAPPAPDVDASLTVKLVCTDTNGRPPRGASVTISGTHLSNSKIEGQRNTQDGIVEFGILPQGGYRIEVATNWGSVTRKISVMPGEQCVVTILCPDDAEERRVPYAFQFDLPDDLAKAKLVPVVGLSEGKLELDDGTWRCYPRSLWLGNLVRQVDANSLHYLSKNMPRAIKGKPGISFSDLERTIQSLFQNSKGQPPEWAVTGAHLRLASVGLVTHLEVDEFGQPVGLPRSGPLVAVQIESTDAGWPVELNADFVVERDRPWKIVLPESLITEARQQIAAQTPGESVAKPVPKDAAPAP